MITSKLATLYLSILLFEIQAGFISLSRDIRNRNQQFYRIINSRGGRNSLFCETNGPTSSKNILEINHGSLVIDSTLIKTVSHIVDQCRSITRQ